MLMVDKKSKEIIKCKVLPPTASRALLKSEWGINREIFMCLKLSFHKTSMLFSLLNETW